jgi:hypothetical protein
LDLVVGFLLYFLPKQKVKGKNKKEMIYPLANLVALQGRFLRNDLTFFINFCFLQDLHKMFVENTDQRQ